MKELTLQQSEMVSGGFEPVMILSFVAGAQELSLTKTLFFSGLFYGSIGAIGGAAVGGLGGLFGLRSAAKGALLGAASGATFGAIDGLLFYGFGSLFTKPDAAVTTE